MDLFNGLHSAFHFTYCQKVSVICGHQARAFLDSDYDGYSLQKFTLMKLENIEMNYCFPNTQYFNGLFLLETFVKLVSHWGGCIVFLEGEQDWEMVNSGSYYIFATCHLPLIGQII